MSKYHLDFTLELTQGSLHNLGDLLLLYRIWASTYLPTGEPAKAMIVLREKDWRLATREIRLTNEATDHLVQKLQTLGLPERSPQIEAAAGNPTGWQRIYLSVSLNGVERTFRLNLQYGGAVGDDAPSLRELVLHLLEMGGLAEEAERLAVV